MILILTAVLGAGSALVAVTMFVVTGSLNAKRSGEEIKELRKGFQSVLILNEQLKHLNGSVDRIAVSIESLKLGHASLENRMVRLENHVIGRPDEETNQQQGKRRTG